jgi:hypothetical protein
MEIIRPSGVKEMPLTREPKRVPSDQYSIKRFECFTLREREREREREKEREREREREKERQRDRETNEM